MRFRENPPPEPAAAQTSLFVEDSGNVVENMGNTTEDRGKIVEDMGNMIEDRGKTTEEMGKIVGDRGKTREKRGKTTSGASGSACSPPVTLAAELFKIQSPPGG